MAHPSHDHLMKVLKESKMEYLAGKFSEGKSENIRGMPSKYEPPTSPSTDSFNGDDVLLSDDEVNSRNEGGTIVNTEYN